MSHSKAAGQNTHCKTYSAALNEKGCNKRISFSWRRDSSFQYLHTLCYCNLCHEVFEKIIFLSFIVFVVRSKIQEYSTKKQVHTNNSSHFNRNQTMTRSISWEWNISPRRYNFGFKFVSQIFRDRKRLCGHYWQWTFFEGKNLLMWAHLNSN